MTHATKTNKKQDSIDTIYEFVNASSVPIVPYEYGPIQFTALSLSLDGNTLFALRQDSYYYGYYSLGGDIVAFDAHTGTYLYTIAAGDPRLLAAFDMVVGMDGKFYISIPEFQFPSQVTLNCH